MRDWYAGHAPAIPGWFLRDFEHFETDEAYYFRWRWYYADAMLRTRQGKEEMATIYVDHDPNGACAEYKLSAVGMFLARRPARVAALRADNAKLAQERDALNLLVRAKSSLGQGDIDGFVADFNELVEEGVNVEAFMNRIRSITGKTALASTAPAPKQEGGAK